ncbi:hypothetical protein N0V93_004414 [Gnomoniopsis smithogilvyi]|uniref:Uncharacterized protein n=1 Tax=Gnomoniopsis smithogilvyi TaxID=1191159 RepID=A0A9W9CX63_9PEZI|nr:hypothetical protein N0V93_004414 [Gnomoniopsis smithogilvyi]
MNRPARYSEYDSKYYEASYQPEASRGRSNTDTTASRAITLNELHAWTKQQEWCERRSTKTFEDGQQRHRAATEDFTEWPSIRIEEPASGPKYSEAPDSESRYNHNFLRPPPSNRDSYFGPPPTEQTGGNGTPPLRRRSTKRMSAVIDLQESSRFGWWTPGLLLATVVMVTITAMYANGSVKSLMQERFFTNSSSNAILVLRILTEACALLLAALVVLVVEDLQWALASRPQGVSLLHFVGLDAGTGMWGLIRLLLTADWSEKYSSLFRLLVICTIPLPGIILMGDITLQLVFFPQHTYPVAAGIDKFNSSFISEVDDTILTALLVSMGSPSWSNKDTWSVDSLGPEHGRCTVSDTDKSWTPCAESHMLTGGILGVSPQSDNLTLYPKSTAYVVPRTRTLQLEYGTVHDIEGLYNNGTCYTVGANYAASYWCTATGEDHELLFGSSYCPLAIQFKGQCLNDTSWTSPLQIASSLFVFKRYATVNYDRGNFSVLSVTDLSPPEQEIIELNDYMTAISAVVPGFRSKDDTAGTSNNVTKGDNSALAIYAVSALPVNDNQVARTMSLAAVRKAMSVPFNYFHANYFSNESIFEVTRPRTGLSEDMYTTMSLAIGSRQVVAGQISRWAFGLLCGILLALSAATIVVTARICERRPQRCGYPTLDFAAVCAVKGGIPRPPSSESDEENKKTGARGLHRSLTSLGMKPGAFQVANRIKGEKVMLG